MSDPAGRTRGRAGQAARSALGLAFSIAAAAGCVSGHEYGPAEASAANPWCERVKPERARVKPLLAEGKLDRAIRVMQRIEGNCADDAELTWADHVAALGAIGRASEARQLADRIDESARATPADRAAAAEARKTAAAHDARPKSVGRAEEEALVELRKAVDAGERGDAAGREAHGLAAWSAFHPNARALVEAGLGARAAGRAADAQRLFDRAAHDDANAPIRPEVRAGSPLDEGASALAFSPDGARLAAASLGFVDVFDASLRLERRINVGEDITALAYSTDGRDVIVGLANGGAKEIDVPMGVVARELPPGRGAVHALAVSPDGKRLAVAREDGSLAFVDLTSGAPAASARAPGAVHLAFRPGGGAIAWASEAGDVGLADAASGAVTKLAHVKGPVRALAFSAPGDLELVTATEHLRYDVAKPQSAPKTIERKLAIEAAATAGAAIVVVREGQVAAFPTAATELGVSARKRPSLEPTAIAVAPGGKSAAVALPTRSLEITSRDGASRRLLHPAAIESIAAPEGGRSLLIGTATGSGCLIAVPAGAARWIDAGVGAHAKVALARDGGALAIGGDAGRVALLDGSGAPRGEAKLDGPIGALAFAPDGKQLAIGGKPALVRLVDAHGGSAKDLGLDGGDVRALAFSPGGERLLAAAGPGLTLWDLASGKGERYTAYGVAPRALAWAPSGGGFAVARGDATLALGAVGKPSPTEVVPMLGSPVDVFFEGTDRIITAEADGSIATRRPPAKVLERVREPGAAARVLASLPGGVAAGMNDGSVRLFLPGRSRAVAAVWPVQGGAVIASADGHVDAASAAGPGASALVCRLGNVAYPFEVCAEQFIVKDLLGVALAGRDPAEADP